ncbi:MAG TPA: FAD-dependent oxidoreductase [Steroidobacteraceae bacterium]|nr:FAD-dependent oxidoreductase [Steroidobacteraceae bacterium]
MPVWQQRSPRYPPARPLSRSCSVDVLVVGGGISGALVALGLAKQGRRVVVVDRRGLGRGSTAASTALLQFELDLPLLQLSRRIGRRDAVRAWQCSLDALRSLDRLIVDDRLAAQVARRPSVYLAGTVLNAAGLQREAALRASAGLPGEWFSRTALARRFGLQRTAAIVSSDNLVVDPRALTAAVLRAAATRHARFFSPVEVQDVHATARRVLAVTDGGAEIEAQALVFCSGYERPKIVPPHGQRISSTWAIATRPQKKRLWPEQCLIWEASDPYLYVRTTPDGRVICGGEDEDFSDTEARDALLPRKTARLSRKLGQLLPDVQTEAEFAWTGSFGQSDSSLPSIGAVPGHPRCYAVMGYGGNGITYSMLASRLICAELSGKRDPDARLFRFR